VPKSGTNSSGHSSCSHSSLPPSKGDAAELGGDIRLIERATAKVETVHDEKEQRLVLWSTDMLSSILKTIVADRIDSYVQPDDPSKIALIENSIRGGADSQDQWMVANEVVEVIRLPKFDAAAQKEPIHPETIELPVAAVQQLEKYVQAVAAMYPDYPFHNFEHASHVALSVQKLLSRIVAPEVAPSDQDADAATEAGEDLHEYTYGMTSDPLLHFALVLAALIHDVDHPGVPNSTLVTLVMEQTSLVAVYKNKSIAEQNSVDLAWALLMDDAFVDLRKVVYTTEEESTRIRQLIVNSVMATDIMDKELGAFRKVRWDKTFSQGPADTNCDGFAFRRKATIVLEHLIQASDVAHTMQHWHVYIKWNERLFEELYKAYLDGRADTDPSISWYQGEMGFFDFPLCPWQRNSRAVESLACSALSTWTTRRPIVASGNKKDRKS